MRRARISIKPNVRPGGRAVASTAQSKTSQESAAVDSTQQTHTGEQIETPSPSPQSHLEVIEPAVGTGDGNVPGCPSEKASVNTGKRVPSSASTPAATALQRRSRISATPNLARPKVRPVPPASTEKTAFLPSQPSKSPEAAVPAATSRDNSQNSTLSDSILKQTTATTISPPSTPSLITSPGFHESSVQKTSPSSTQPQQEPHTPKKSRSGPQEAVSPSSSILSPCIKLSRCDGPGSPLKNSEMSDKQRVLRALKLKELMKMERKELMKRKSRRHMYEHSDEVDCSKMTLADFIYYLPETNPMKSSLSTEQTPAETVVPPSPKVPTKLAEPEEEDDDNGDDELMVPKVRVAEDGTLILDEDSLTVRVKRTSDTVVDDATPLFERGSTTTYKSFRKSYYVKCWSVRETDMFYLAISMVGTDFSMMAQLLTHRSRTEIKSKFKKEEKLNSWRVDKAFRNKQPFDKEFFSFLLKKVLEKDKKRGQSIKLVVKPNKANKGKGGNKGKKHEDEDIDDDDIEDELDIGDNGSLDLEKENEDSNNVKVSDVTSSKKRKRKTEPKGSPGEKTCKRKKKNSKKAEGEESEHLQVEDDSVNAENKDPTLMPKAKKKRKRSRKGEEKRCEEELEDKHKAKRNKKTVKVPDEEPVDVDGENGQASMEHKTADTSKTCKRSKKSKEKPAKGKPKTKKSKKSSEECIGDELNTVSSEVSTAGPDAEEDQGEKLTPETTASQEETPQNTSKRCKRPLPKILKRKAKKSSVSTEEEDVAPEGQDPNCRETESEFQVDSLADSQLQKQAVVVLERTPPRLIKTHGWTVSPDQSQTAQSLQGSPGRQTRAEKVKQNLTGSESERNEKEKMDECQTASGSDTFAKGMTMTALTCQDDTQESKEREADKHMVEDLGIQHHLQVSTEVNGQMFLKTPVVKVSHEEVHRYLAVQTKTTEENSSASESQLDAVSAEDKSVEEHMDGPVEKCSSGVILVSQDPGIKESASSSSQQYITQKRKWFTKPTPNLSRSQQAMEKPLSMQTTEYSENNADSLRSCPVEDTMTALNECPGSPEEHPTSSETLKENDFQELRVNESNLDDIETTIDDDLSFSLDEETPTVSKNVVQEILSFLEKPNLSPALSDEDVAERMEPLEMALSETWENKQQITDLEDCDSHSETMTEEPLELTVPSSYFKQSGEGSQWNTEHYEDSISEISDVRGCQSPAEAMYCELDLSMKKNISTEDKIVSYEANLQECKQAQDPLSPVQLLDPKRTKGLAVQVKDPVLSDVLVTLPDTCSQVSTEALGASFSEAPTKYPSNTCDMNTVLFCGTTAEEIQRSVNFCEENVNSNGKMQHSISDSVKEGKAENLSKTAEDFRAPLKGKSDILDSAGVETDNQTEEEPTFVLTLYEIPTSQLFHEASCGHQDMSAYELQPAEVHTPCLISNDSQSLPFTLEESSALLHMKSEETEKPCKSASEKMVDDLCVLEDAVKDANTQLSEKSSSDDGGSQEMLSYNDSVPTDVTSVLTLEEKPSECTERKACQRRSKIKVKPNIRPCAKAGPSKTASNLKTTANLNKPTYHAAQHSETESKHKTSVQKTVVSFVSNIHSNPEDSKRQNHHEGPLTDSMPVSEDMKDEVPVMWGSPLKTELQMGMDTAVDLSVRSLSDVPDLHSTAIEEFREEVEDGCEGVSHVVLVDGLVIASGEMKDKDRLLGDFESERPLPTFYDQEIFTDISKERDTYDEALNLTSTSQDRTEPFKIFSQGTLEVTPEINQETTCTKDESSRQENLAVRSKQPAITQIIVEHQIEEESDKVKEKAKQEDFSDNKEDTALNLTEEVLKAEQQLAPLTSTCAETQSVEKTEDDPEDVTHVVLSDMLVAVSEENEDEIHINSESSLLHLYQSCEDPCATEKEQNLNTNADQEVEEHKAVSHMVLSDIVIPVSEEVEDDLSKEGMTIRDRSPCEAESSKAKEHPLCAVSESTNMGSSLSPRKRMPTKKGLLKVKMIFPERRKGESSGSVEQSPTFSAEPLSTSTLKQQNICTLKSLKESNSDKSEDKTKYSSPFESESFPPWQQTQCSVKTICANSPSIESADTQEVCEGVSHTVFSDIFVPVSNETAESSLHKEALMVSSQEPSERVKSLATERPSDTERQDLPASRSSEQNIPSCRRVTQTAQSLEPQAEEEWSLRSHMLPMDSYEIENWCEGVSHMLLSDAFVPVSEEENSTDQKEFVASGPHEDVENARSLPECSGTTDNANNEHQVDSIPGMQKLVQKTKEKLLESQTKTSPERRSTLQMTLRSPRRSPKSLNSTQAVPTTPQRATTSKEKKESIQTPTRLQGEEIIRECRIPLERLSLEEICQHDLHPKHHSTPVNVKFFSKENESRMIGSGSHAAQELTMPSGGWPKVLLNRIKINATDADTSTSTSSPARVSTTAYQPVDNYQSSPHNSGLNTDDEPASVSQFFLDNIFTEVEDPE